MTSIFTAVWPCRTARRIHTSFGTASSSLKKACRLLPFVSFDGVSYAAGLSRLHLWRFLVATLAGILPASFLLAHFGAVAASGSFGAAEWIVTGLGLLTALPLIGLGLRRARGDRTGPTTTVKSASSSSLAETSVDGVEDRPENDRDIPPP